MGIYALTGGASGIGAAIKQSLLDAEHRVIVVDIRQAEVEADLSDQAGRRHAIAGIQQAAPDGLDGIITCAGLASHTPDTRLIASVNYYGTVELIAGVKPLLVKNSGSAVLISSNSAPMCTSPELVSALLDEPEEAALAVAAGLAGQQAYSGSKQAVARWMRRHAAGYVKEGVRMNAIAPGYTETPMTKAVAEDPTYGDAIRQFVASIPVGRPGLPQDMANTVDFLLSDKAGFICGSVLFVDGGHDAMMRPEQF